ncbi:MAG: efflux RND transporter periplasmic adaptor subunit [Pseudomonadales bacterium]
MSTRAHSPLRILLVPVIATLLFACSDQAPEPQAPPPAVTVYQVTPEEVHPAFEFVGRTKPVEDVAIRARIQGYLLNVSFDEGEVIEEGQLLFEIDAQPYEAEVARKKADIARAQADKVVAENNYKRGKRLIPNGTISQSEYEELEAKFKGASSLYNAALASHDVAMLNLRYTSVVAPITGRIGRKALSIGDLVTPSDTLTTLVQEDPMHVLFQVSEKIIVGGMQKSRILDGTDLKPEQLIPYLKLADGSEYMFSGEIDFLDNRIDTNTGTITVRAAFPNPNGLLIPGQYVKVFVRNINATTALIVPQKSVQEDQQGRYVLVVNEDDEVEVRRVKLGSRIELDWLVDAGLSEGDLVITQGIQKVRVGMVVNPVLERPDMTPAALTGS